MAFFISDATISASIGLYARVLISGPKEDDGSDVKKDMLWYFFLSYSYSFRNLTDSNVIPIAERNMIYSGTVCDIFCLY